MGESSSEIYVSFGLVVVGLFWGITNPYIEQGSTQGEKKYDPMDFSWKGFIQVFFRLKVLIPFIINQVGSLLYYILLGKAKISIGPAIANSVSTIMTIITEHRLKKIRFTLKKMLGFSLIISGVVLCILP